MKPGSPAFPPTSWPVSNPEPPPLSLHSPSSAAMDPPLMNGVFAARMEIDQIPVFPPRGGRHRRFHSDTFFHHLPDDILFDAPEIDNLSFTDLDMIPASFAGTPDVSGGIPMAVDSSRSDESSSAGAGAGHLRCLSMDADFFEGLSFEVGAGGGGDGGGSAVGTGTGMVVGEKKGRSMHRHSRSMDWGLTASFEGDLGIFDGVKKAMPREKLAELALIDPKRAKRILANRQSAARSKERKIRYTSELEKKVQALQTEATTVCAQVTILQRDAIALMAENRELKLRLEALEQQAQLREALHKALREDVERLRIATGRSPPITSNGAIGELPLFSLRLQGDNAKHTQQQQLVLMTQPSHASNIQAPNQWLQPDFFGFSHRVQ